MKIKKNTSELRSIVTAEAFEKAYKYFIEQADKNVVTKRACGSKIPYGFSEKVECDGYSFKAQYGQGTPSATPYMNWWVVSIYYISENRNIIIGIEEDRYHKIHQLGIKPLSYERIGNKKGDIAVFYRSNKQYVDYKQLYQKFIDVCEEIIELGLD